jgi:hypothetical protein
VTWLRTSTVEHLPADPLGDAVAAALADVALGAEVELAYTPIDEPVMPRAGPPGWRVDIVLHHNERVARLVASGERPALVELLDVVSEAGLRTAAAFRRHQPDDGVGINAALKRALRDAVAGEILTRYLARRTGHEAPELIAETIEYLLELGGTRVESHELTHGVVIADVFADAPRLEFAYPADIRTAKRASLLFDGQRSLLVVDTEGRARSELQRHRLELLDHRDGRMRMRGDDLFESGALIADATSILGGLGFFLRADRTIWTFVDGRPLLVRRGEHWTAFPLELGAAIEEMAGRSSEVATLVANAAFRISAQPSGAILAVVDDPTRLDGVVSPKDRYDLRDDVDREAMQIETRLHHLIDAEPLDEQTLVRLAMLDGATIVDRQGHLLAYGAIVTSKGSQYEGARTAAARTLSKIADVVLNVSVDGDITIFRHGTALTTLLGRAAPSVNVTSSSPATP